MSMFRWLGVGAVALVLSACGGGGSSCKLSVGGLSCKEYVANVAPVARASGPSQVVTGSVVTLDATGSTDANQDPLSFNWTWSSKPSTSAATLSSATAGQPTFTADVSGTYVLTLTVSDGTLLANPAVVTIIATTNNVAPVASAGDDQSVVIGPQGTVVTLDGTNSTDANPGDVISYNWSLSRPTGSAAVLDSATVSKPKFTADVAGTYLATLTVSDGKLTSTLASTRVVASTLNAAPVANAGPNQSVVAGMQVMLDGTASSDANLDLITYSWTSIYKPAGSTAALDVPTSVRPKFTADVPGNYVWGLVVNDGKLNSASSTVTVTAAPVNAAPVARAGSAQNVITGSQVTLSGAGSTDANGDALTYKWSMVSKPDGSNAALSSATVVSPTFTTDVSGTYVVVLVVNDGALDSAVAATSVTAALANVMPVANPGNPQTVNTATLVTLSGAASTDANPGDVLTYRWTLTTRPTNSTSTLTVNPTNSAIVTFTPDLSGFYIATLIVNDGKVDSKPATVLITVN